MLSAASASGANQIAPETLAKIALRVLSYDKTLATTAGDSFKIAVIHTGSESALYKAFRKFHGHVIQKLPVEVVSLEYRDAGQLGAALRSGGVDAVVVAESLAAQVQTIAGVCRGQSVRTLGVSEEMVRNGLSITVVAKAGKPHIVVNLTAAKSEGMNLSAEVLGLSTVIR